MRRRDTGILGEKLARDFLKKRGYRIQETNYRCPEGEIDIVAAHKDFLGEDKEALLIYAKSILETQNTDYFIFGHRHIAISYQFQAGAQVIFLGDWVNKGSYAEWDGKSLTLKLLD